VYNFRTDLNVINELQRTRRCADASSVHRCNDALLSFYTVSSIVGDIESDSESVSCHIWFTRSSAVARQRNRATLRVNKYFAKSFKVTQDHAK